jgi:hypothetical protein
MSKSKTPLAIIFNSGPAILTFAKVHAEKGMRMLESDH